MTVSCSNCPSTTAASASASSHGASFRPTTRTKEAEPSSRGSTTEQAVATSADGSASSAMIDCITPRCAARVVACACCPSRPRQRTTAARVPPCPAGKLERSAQSSGSAE